LCESAARTKLEGVGRTNEKNKNGLVRTEREDTTKNIKTHKGVLFYPAEVLPTRLARNWELSCKESASRGNKVRQGVYWRGAVFWGISYLFGIHILIFCTRFLVLVSW